MGLEVHKVGSRWAVIGDWFIPDRKGRAVRDSGTFLFVTKFAAENFARRFEKDQVLIIQTNELCRQLRREAIDKYLAKRAKRSADHPKLF